MSTQQERVKFKMKLHINVKKLLIIWKIPVQLGDQGNQRWRGGQHSSRRTLPAAPMPQALRGTDSDNGYKITYKIHTAGLLHS